MAEATALPKKLSALIELALGDLEKAVKDGGYKIAMGMWQCRTVSTCRITTTTRPPSSPRCATWPIFLNDMGSNRR